MDPLYIVELDCTPTDPAATASDVFDILLAHTHEWLTWDVYPLPDIDLASAGGEVDLPFKRGDSTVDRRAKWSTLSADGARMTQLTMTQPLLGAPGASFVTDITVFQQESEVILRMALGRAIPAGRLIPASVQYLRRPGLLRKIMRDPRIVYRAQTQRVDGRYVTIGYNKMEHQVLAESIEQSVNRLPLLLVDGRNAAIGKEFARVAATELSGLARVVVIFEAAMRSLAPTLDPHDLSLPDGGARLIWPPPLSAATHPAFTEDELCDEQAATESLLRTLARVSVAARGRNVLAKRFAEVERRVRERTFEKTIAQARNRGDIDAEVETLRAHTKDLDTQVDFWFNHAGELEQQVADLQSAKAELEYWKGQVFNAQRTTTPTGQSWQEAPLLERHDLTDLAAFLSTITDGAVVFTASAHRSWKNCNYPHVDQMHEHLVRLARAAMDFRNRNGAVGTSLDEWFRLQWDVVMASTDKGLENAGRDTFNFEGTEYSQVPHLKLDDHVSPNEVGRIYFARDNANLRFIVNHVGLKLYGL